MLDHPKRPRGAPRGNRNAVKDERQSARITLNLDPQMHEAVKAASGGKVNKWIRLAITSALDNPPTGDT